MHIFNDGTVNLYTASDNTGEHSDEAFFGQSCEIIEKTGRFYRVHTCYGYDGYIDASRVTECEYAPDSIVISPFADLLAQPRNYGAPSYVLPRGSLLMTRELDGRYAAAITPDGSEYYIHKKSIIPLIKFSAYRKSYTRAEEAELRAGIVAEAKKYIGVQYRWGGKTAAGIDCSGLAFMAYYAYGIYLYRDAHVEKSLSLRQINFEEKKEGDLIFYKGHVTVYIGGNELIHASASSGAVCISNIAESEYLSKEFTATATIF